jgi:hypothetical protein
MPNTNLSLLPNFLIIGSAKCGTTTLQRMLIRHPEIYMPAEKEINFYSFDHLYSKGIDWYINSYFKQQPDAIARGEASPTYISRGELVASRIKETYKDRPIRIIAIFRDPVQRAYSAYWHWVRNGAETLSFSDALQAEEDWFNSHPDIYNPPREQRRYFYVGRYATHLRPFLKCFPRENFLFLCLEDLQDDLSSTMIKLCNFLKVDPTISFTSTIANQASMPRIKLLQKILLRPSDTQRKIIKLMKTILPFSFRKDLRRKLLRGNLRPYNYPSMNAQLEEKLRNRYLNEIFELEELINRDLSHWRTPK